MSENVMCLQEKAMKLQCLRWQHLQWLFLNCKLEEAMHHTQPKVSPTCSTLDECGVSWDVVDCTHHLHSLHASCSAADSGLGALDTEFFSVR